MKNPIKILLSTLTLVSISFGAQAQVMKEITVTGSAVGEVDVYVAEGGDTLWDVADRFFEDPWYWPTLWSFNPHITNPNWIFPGDMVFLVPPKPKPIEKEGFELTEARYSVGPQWEQVLGRRVGFVSEDEYEGSGVINFSREEEVMLSETDEIYIRFETARRIKAGDLFLVYRVEGEVEHPVTDDFLGYKIRYLGIAKATSTEKPETKAVLLETFREVEREDRVSPFAPVARTVPPVRNAAAVAGIIILAFDEVVMLGEYHYVVIDRGASDGVSAGNRFIARERGDGRIELDEDELEDFPYEKYGEILIIETQDTTSLGIVTYAIREFEVGAPVDMLPGY